MMTLLKKYLMSNCARAGILTALAGSALFSIAACSSKDACDNVAGACLSLRVEGSGSYESLRMTLLLNDNTTKTGDVAEAVNIPTVVRVVPPPGISTETVTSL